MKTLKNIDLINLPVSTVFHVINGDWSGCIFLRDGKKFVHIYEVNEDRIINKGFVALDIQILRMTGYVKVLVGEKLREETWPLWEYLDHEARRHGFDDYEDLVSRGFSLTIPEVMEEKETL